MTTERKHRRCLIGHGFVRFQTPEAFRVSAFDGFVRFVFKKKTRRSPNSSANLRDLWETTKRPMRLKKQMGEFAHRSQTITDAMRGAWGVSIYFVA